VLVTKVMFFNSNGMKFTKLMVCDFGRKFC